MQYQREYSWWSEAFTLQVDDLLKKRQVKIELIEKGIIRLTSHQNGKHLKGKAILVLNNGRLSLSQYLKDKLQTSMSQEDIKVNFNPVAFKRNFLFFASCFYDHVYYRTGISKYEFKFLCDGELKLVHNPKLNVVAQSLIINLNVMDGKMRQCGTQIAIGDLNFLRLQYCNPTAHNDHQEEDDNSDGDLETVGLEREEGHAKQAKGKRKLFVYSTPSDKPSPASKFNRIVTT